MDVVVEAPGFLTTVQDRGRFGYEQFGVNPAGAMDWKSMQLANVLVGNDPDEAALEITVMGPTLRFTAAAVVAVTGADLSFAVNGQRRETYRAIAIRAGDEISFGAPLSGCRAYLAFAGGLAIPSVLGSRSTLYRYRIGGFQGRGLKRGDRFQLRKEVASLINMEDRVLPREGDYAGLRRIRVIMGPQDDRFTQRGIDRFLSGSYSVGKDFDRMGYRLEGPVVEHKTDGNIISDGIVFGSIQVPSDGHPIIMMADRQTVGGYTKIATVITVDLPIIGQCRAGDRLRFQATGIDEAQALYAAWCQRILQVQRRLEDPRQCAITAG